MTTTALESTIVRAEGRGLVATAHDRLTTILGSPRAVAVFGTIVFLTTVIQVLSSPFAFVIQGDQPWPLTLPLLACVVIVTIGCALQAMSLALSPRRPVLALLGTVTCYLLLILIVGAPNWLPAMQLVVAIAFFLLATQRSLRSPLLWLIFVIVLDVATLFAWGLSTGAGLVAVVGFVVANGVGFATTAAGATALGTWWRARSRQVAEIREEAERASREQEARLENARNAERARIAQELHDVAGQHLAGLIALADAAVAIGDDRPDEALQLVRDVRAEGRFAAASVYSALSDLRAVGGVPAGATRDLRRVTELVAYWRQREMPVTLHVDGDLDELPAVVSTSVFRGVQEALTNASKHAPGASVDVAFVWSGDWLQSVIENGPPAGVRATTESIGLGWGLEGLRDRITMMNGTVTAGATDQGGWKVRIRIPVVEPEALEAG